MTQFVTLVRHGNVGLVTIDNPPVNALSHVVRIELRDVLTSAARDPEVEALVIACAGRTFVAGADIKEFGRPPLAPDLPEVIEFVDTLDKPVVAALHGTALGGGLELALACDLILCSDRARFGQPEVNLGLIPGFGGTFRLAARTGVGWARRLIYTGEIIDATRAEAIGLVDAVVPASELLARARELAREIAKKAPLAVRAAKRSILRGLGRDSSLLADHEALRFSELFATEDVKEGLSAFLGKRTPNFDGR